MLICGRCIASPFAAMCNCLSVEGNSACQQTKILASQFSLATDWNISSPLKSRHRHQAPLVRNITHPWVVSPWAAAGGDALSVPRHRAPAEPTFSSIPPAPHQLCVPLCTPAPSGTSPRPLWLCWLILHWGTVITHCCQAEHGCLSVALEELVFHLIYTSNQAN